MTFETIGPMPANLTFSGYINQQSASSKPLEGLYLVATPIGNLEDMSLRALRILSACNVIACEDTRQTQKLLNAYGIKTKTTAYHDHNEAQKSKALLKQLQQGQSIALVSDAGMPLVADPGFKLVQLCQENSVPVTCVPGPSSVLVALALAGLACDQFTFAGFLPSKSGARRTVLENLKEKPQTLIFFEAARRLEGSLSDLADLYPERPMVLARELTKTYEEVLRGTPESLLEEISREPRKGECVLVVAGQPQAASGLPAKVVRDIRLALDRMSLKDAVELIAAIHDRPKRQIYQQALALSDSTE